MPCCCGTQAGLAQRPQPVPERHADAPTAGSRTEATQARPGRLSSGTHLVPADWSCHLAIQLECTKLGQRQGCIRGRSIDGPSRHIQQMGRSSACEPQQYRKEKQARRSRWGALQPASAPQRPPRSRDGPVGPLRCFSRTQPSPDANATLHQAVLGWLVASTGS